MKEHVEFITDSFVDYAGKTHYFVIAALSQNLPSRSSQLENNPGDDYDVDVTYDVSVYVDGYGPTDYLGTVNKVLRLGVSICNPIDAFDEKVGMRKAVARAHNSRPVLYSSNSGAINTGVVKALLTQEAQYLKNNPENFIPGYADMRDRYLARQKMEAMKEGFSDIENQVVEGLQTDPKFLDNAMRYLDWLRKQNNGC